jgi:hypothetical protein
VVALSGAVAAISFGMQGTTTGSCLIASPSFLLLVAAGFLRAGSRAIDLAAVTSPTNKNEISAAFAQKHPVIIRFLHTFKAPTGLTWRKPALCFSRLQQSSVLPYGAWPPRLPILAEVLCSLDSGVNAGATLGNVDNARRNPDPSRGGIVWAVAIISFGI